MNFEILIYNDKNHRFEKQPKAEKANKNHEKQTEYQQFSVFNIWLLMIMKLVCVSNSKKIVSNKSIYN